MLLVLGFALVIFFDRMLAPLLASVVIADLLQGPVRFLQARNLPRLAAVLIFGGIWRLWGVFFAIAAGDAGEGSVERLAAQPRGGGGTARRVMGS